MAIRRNARLTSKGRERLVRPSAERSDAEGIRRIRRRLVWPRHSVSQMVLGVYSFEGLACDLKTELSQAASKATRALARAVGGHDKLEPTDAASA